MCNGMGHGQAGLIKKKKTNLKLYLFIEIQYSYRRVQMSQAYSPDEFSQSENSHVMHTKDKKQYHQRAGLVWTGG
jgi:hypothetical protein